MALSVFLWLGGFWLAGWAVLPTARHLFPALPDCGLAAARVLFIAFASLIAFWLASFHIAPLGIMPLLFLALAVASLSPLCSQCQRAQFLQILRVKRRALFVSDAIFVAAFLVFGWIRWRNPALNSLEKPMDIALMSALWRADWLPLENPWLCATPFTGYYIFGPMMAANSGRCFGASPIEAYNLVQPAWCALFVSALFSLCSALLHSAKRGAVAMALVALLGNFQALQQVWQNRALWPLDGWATSRVIPNTINEYPFFTLAAGDLHAHFFALALETALACLCWNLVAQRAKTSRDAAKSTVDFDRTLFVQLAACGAMLAVIAMTNPWNLPLESLLVVLCALVAVRGQKRVFLILAVAPLLLARLLLWPHLRVFRPAISGAAFELWIPEIRPFLLVWSGWIALFCAALWLAAKPLAKNEFSRNRLHSFFSLSARAQFCGILAACGIAAVLIPCGVTILGAFQNSALRHNDTVFKFGLQAWLLGGTAAACGAISAWHKWPRTIRAIAPVFLFVPALGTLGVTRQWTVINAPHEHDVAAVFSLDGTRHLPADERAAILWLSRNARAGEAVLEAIGPDSYSEYARVSALSGVPTVLGWPQHVAGWGGNAEEIARRATLVNAAFNSNSERAARRALIPLRSLGVKWIFLGALERRDNREISLAALRATGGIAFQSGATVILRMD